MVEETAAGFFRTTGIAPEHFSFHIAGEVPPARGLGSSATIITGVLAGLDALHGTGLARQQLAALATALEGNPDNVSPSVLGGFTVSRCDPATGAYLDTIRIPVPADVVFVVASPELETITRESRGALPSTLSHRDAARSVNSAAYLTAAFATGDFEKLRHAVGDFLHEPYRLPKIPGASAAIAAGVSAGALTGWLSGSGSSVLCVSRPATAEAVATAMREAFTRVGLGSQVRLLTADNDGLRIEET
jgi:homoserine kinase